MTASPEERDYTVYLRRTGGRQQELADYLETSCRKLLDSDAFVDGDGTIFYSMLGDVPHNILAEGMLPPEYVIISRMHPQANIYALHTRYQNLKEKVIHRITAEDGSVETGIRAMDYILQGESGRETKHATVVKQRAHELLDLFSIDFTSVTEEEFAAAQAQTYGLLTAVGYDPETVLNTEKQRMAGWILKGSSGKDSIDRVNRLISVAALSAAYRHAIVRHRGIGIIEGKFFRMREAFIFEREFSRAIFSDVIEYLREEALPSHRLFKFPLARADNVGIVTAILHNMVFQLKQPHVKTYRTVGWQAAEIVHEIMTLLSQDNRQEVIKRHLFSQARNLLSDELTKRSAIYPPAESSVKTI